MSDDLTEVRGPARRSVGLMFFCQGIATGAWVTRLPSIKAALHLGTGELGLALLGAPIGLVLAVRCMPFVVARASSARTARWGIAVAVGSIVLPAAAWSLPTLAVSLVVLGAAFGVCDLSVNLQAVAVEQAFERPLMSGLHARWSFGLLTGSLISAAAARTGVRPLPEVLVVASALSLAVNREARGFLCARHERAADAARFTGDGEAPGESLWSRSELLIVATIAFCAFLAEGSVSDWSGVYLRSAQHASFAVAALGVSVYGVCAALVRLAGNRVIERLGRVTTLWRTTLVAASGMTLALIARSPAVALAGYAIFGAGNAVVVPTTFSLAGDAGVAGRTQALARVTTFAYGGLLAGPPLIGLVAHVSDLATGLAIPMLLLFGITPLALRLGAVRARER